MIINYTCLQGNKSHLFLQRSVADLIFINYQQQMENLQIENSNENYSQTNEIRSDRFTIKELVTLIDKNLLQSIENIYRLKQDGLDLLQFTRFFMNCIQHQDHENPLLAAGLLQLFQAINNGSSKVKFSHLTDFICQHILENGSFDKELQTKWIPYTGHGQTQQKYLKNPPNIRGQCEEIYKVWLGNEPLDNGKHQNIISHACYSQTRKKIYCLQSLADSIAIYTPNSNLEKTIKPSSFQVKKDSAVIAISFSEKQQRLGAILKDFSISLWDAQDNYTFQKSINSTKYCQDFQTSIWYLQFFQKWVTSDIVGKLYLWNLLKQQPSKILQCKNKSKISQICEIPSMFVLAVAQQQKSNHPETAKIQLISLRKDELVAQIDTKVQRRMLHTIRYSEEYQVLLSAGYQKKINLFEINSVYLDSSLRGQLLGHQSAITTFALIKKTPMVVSADDRGKIKIWNIKNFKCVQTLDFSDKVIITKILDMANQKKIALVGSRIILLNLENPPEHIEDVVPLKSKFSISSLLVLTSHDIRLFDLNTGKLIDIDCRHNKSAKQITATIILAQNEVVTGNQKGQISFFSKNTGKISQIQQWHLGPVMHIQEDILNKLLLTYSDQSGFIVVGKVHNSWESIRELKCNFVGKQISSIVLSGYHSLVGFIVSKTVYLCDYELLKVRFRLDFYDQQPTSLAFINGLGILLISTSEGQIYAYEIQKQSLTFRICIKCSIKNITHLTTDFKCKQFNNKTQFQTCYITCSFQNGKIQNINFIDYAKSINFKTRKFTGVTNNSHRQIRQNFQLQIKKNIFQIITPIPNGIQFTGAIQTLSGHNQGVTSLLVAQMDEHLLISTGNDRRIKIWRCNELIGDLNINLPLPYLWNLDFIGQRKTAKRILQGLELIQYLFKRFGKDISIGEAQIFKLSSRTSAISGRSSIFQTEPKRKLKKKPTLFHEEFSSVDLNYEKIKREKIIQLNGPSLKRMELTKNIDILQKQWNISKNAQQHQKNALLKTILTKVQKNEEKQKILIMLREKTNSIKQKSPQKDVFINNLQKKLDVCVEKKPDKNTLKSSFLSKTCKDQSMFRFCSKLKEHNRTNSKQTLENYFNQKYKINRELSQTSLGPRTNRNTPRCSQTQCDKKNNSFYMNQKKQNNFRIILKEMREKLCKSKKYYFKNDMLSKRTSDASVNLETSQFFYDSNIQLQHTSQK